MFVWSCGRVVVWSCVRVFVCSCVRVFVCSCVCSFIRSFVRSCAIPHFSRRVRAVWLYSLWISVMHVQHVLIYVMYLPHFSRRVMVA